MSETNRVAATVRAEMARRRTRQTVLAQRLGMSSTAVSRRLTGETPFSVPELMAVADVLGMPVADLMPETTAGSAA
jgi:transcriptional regulator with XRE-family HTH domain